MGINDSTQNTLVSYYDSFLREKQSEHKNKYKGFEGFFSASTAGSCFKKQYYNVNGYKGSDLKSNIMRLLRLGTLIHQDFADSMEKYRNKIESDGFELFVEHKIILEEYNVVGHLDLGIYSKEENTMYITDIKSSAAYKWQRTFGRKYKTVASVNYYLQLATYALGLLKQLKDKPDNIELSLTWYKKDDSMVRAQKINNEWMEEAKEYWINLNKVLKDYENEEIPIGLKLENSNKTVVPIEHWECRYCPYHKIHCEGI